MADPGGLTGETGRTVLPEAAEVAEVLVVVDVVEFEDVVRSAVAGLEEEEGNDAVGEE